MSSNSNDYNNYNDYYDYNDEVEYDDKLVKLRLELDELDREIVDLLNKRFSICIEIAERKIKTNKAVVNIARQNQILSKIKIMSDIKFKRAIEEIYINIFKLSTDLQEKYIKNEL